MNRPVELLTAHVEGIGFWAAVFTTIAFVPQVLRSSRVGTDDLSAAMLGLFGIGVGLWFIYGYLRGSGPLMLANGLTGAQILLIVVIKIRHERHEARRRRRIYRA